MSVSGSNVRPDFHNLVYDDYAYDNFGCSAFVAEGVILPFDPTPNYLTRDLSILDLFSEELDAEDFLLTFCLSEYSYQTGIPCGTAFLAMLWCLWFPPAPPFVSGEASNPGPPKMTVSSVVVKTTKKKRNRKRKSRVGLPPSGNISSLPAAIGYVQNSNTFSISQSVQRTADQDWKNGVRCSGCALLAMGVNTYSTYTTGTIQFTGGLVSIGAPGRGYSYLAPNEIDPRLASLVSCYQYYAFRRLCLKYVSSVGTSTSGTVFIAIAKDPEEAVTLYSNVNGSATSPSTGTVQDVMDTDPSVASTVWQPAVLEFIHRGNKLWETFPNGEEPIVARIQACIVCLVQAPSFTTDASFLWGNLYLEYEIDLYVPGPPLSSN